MGTDEELQSLRRQLGIHKKNLLRLEEQAATYGMDVPLRLSNQIDHEKEEIARIEKQIAQLKETRSSFVDAFKAAGPIEEIIEVIEATKVLGIEAKYHGCHIKGQDANLKLYIEERGIPDEVGPVRLKFINSEEKTLITISAKLRAEQMTLTENWRDELLRLLTKAGYTPSAGAVSHTADLEKWLDSCHNFVVDTSGERRAHIYARQAMLASEVPPNWWDSHNALDERARIIELGLQDHILPRAETLDPQLADILRCLDEAFGKLRLAIRNVWSDRPELESEHGMAKARLNALLGMGNGYVDLPCPLCDDRFESKQELKDHFFSNHPAPSPNDQVLISVGIHYINVDKTVGPLRELIRQAKHRIASLQSAAD
jgi:hypothetical protein